jgi:hypothetical protein
MGLLMSKWKGRMSTGDRGGGARRQVIGTREVAIRKSLLGRGQEGVLDLCGCKRPQIG